MKRTAAILFLLAALSMKVGAQMHRYDIRFTLSEADFADTIPIRFQDDQIYIDVEIGGEKHVMNFDTGSSQGVVYDNGRIKPSEELGGIISKDANERKDTVRAVVMPDFRLGRLMVSQYVATMMPRSHVPRTYDAILGFDIVNKGLLCKIDAKAGHMILTDREGWFDDEAGYEVKYKLHWFVPHVWVSPFIRHMDKALFDTGSRPLYTMNKASFDKHAYKSKNVESQVESRSKGHLAIGNFGAEAIDEVVFLNLDRLKWDEFSFRNVNCITTQGSSRIGAAILNYGSIVIDPLRKRIKIQPYGGADSCIVENKPFGVAFVPVNGRAAVGLIREACEEYKNGMRQGDIIAKINGEAIDTFEAFTRYRFVKGEEYVFTLIDERGFMKEVKSRR